MRLPQAFRATHSLFLSFTHTQIHSLISINSFYLLGALMVRGVICSHFHSNTYVHISQKPVVLWQMARSRLKALNPCQMLAKQITQEMDALIRLNAKVLCLLQEGGGRRKTKIINYS